MVTVNGEKMSKSLGNFTTIRDLLDGAWAGYPQPVNPMAVRLFVLQGHYRKPLDFTKDAIAAAINSWQTLRAGVCLAIVTVQAWDGPPPPFNLLLRNSAQTTRGSNGSRLLWTMT